MRSTRFVWSSPVPLPDMEAHALALCLRLADIKMRHGDFKPRKDRLLDPPSALQKKHISAIEGAVAFILSKIREENIKSEEELGAMILSAEEDQIAKWIDGNMAEIRKVRGMLKRLLPTKEALGFRCVG